MSYLSASNAIDGEFDREFDLPSANRAALKTENEHSAGERDGLGKSLLGEIPNCEVVCVRQKVHNVVPHRVRLELVHHERACVPEGEKITE